MALDLIFGVSNLGEEESVFIRSWQTMFSEPRTLRALILWPHTHQGRWLGEGGHEGVHTCTRTVDPERSAQQA